MDFSQDFVDPPVVPKDDLLYLQKELEEHLSKAEDAVYSDGNHAEGLNGGVIKSSDLIPQSIFSEQSDSPTPSIEEDYLPPAPPPEKSYTSVHGEEEEFQEHDLPEIPHQEEVPTSEFTPGSTNEEKVSQDKEIHNEEGGTLESTPKHCQGEIPVLEHSDLEQTPDHLELETSKGVNEEGFDKFKPESQEPYTEGVGYCGQGRQEIAEEEFGHEDHFEKLPETFPLEEYTFENQESKLEQEQEEPERQGSFENQAHQESFVPETEDFIHDPPVEQPPNPLPLPELLHASEEFSQADPVLESPVGHMETPEDIGLLDNAHLSLVGRVDQLAAEKHETTPLHYTEGDDAGEVTIADFEQEASLSSREHNLEENRYVADTFGVVISENQLPPQQPVMKAAEPVFEEAKPTFEEIKRDLEKKNIVGSLQAQPPQSHHRAGLSDMEPTNQGGNYSERNIGAHMNGSSYASHRPPSGQMGSTDNTISRAGGSREGRGNAPAGIAQVRQTLALPDLQLSHVTVFTDRAELVRTITPVFKAGEIVEMLFENVSSAIDKDSIRVELRGAATILDVAYSARTIPHLEETWTQKIWDLQTELRQCHRQIEALNGRLARLEKQRSVLDTFADGMTKKTEEEVFAAALPQQPPPLPQHDKKHDKHSKKLQLEDNYAGTLAKRSMSELNNQANPYDPTHMDTLQRFLTMYEDQAERLDSSLLSSKEELDRTRDRAEQIEKELAVLEKRQDNNLVRTPQSTLVNASSASSSLSRPPRPVSAASRCKTPRLLPSAPNAHPPHNENGSHTQEALMESKRQKKTGKYDSSPAVTRKPPPIPPQSPPIDRMYPSPNAAYIPEEDVAIIGNYLVATLPRSRTSSMSQDNTRLRRSNSRNRASIFDESPRVGSTPMNTLQRATSYETGGATLRNSSISRAASRQALGTSLFMSAAPPGELQNTPVGKAAPASIQSVATVIFEVPRPPVLVPCNEEEIRVTVGLIDLQPTYDYVTVPKRSLSAFLKAHVKNSSNFYILPGQTNIYSDNTFIGKSELGAVAPGEDLSCDLGAESGIEVVYRPMFKSKENASGQKATVSFKQVIDVRNTFQRPVRVMVVDQLPSSGEDKIKVSLIEPNIKNPEKYDRKKPIRMNKNHNIEWDLDLHAGETKEVVLRYNVEYPAVEELEVSVAEE
ncbi:unnamed protein product [Rodentolepis nana]|uniref:DUF4139 domain-containing protein n=1 Tax=Rodentolepis nana TaxID=102285 RepID=A0A3P7SEM3_RODNA|nr:unnamed protein product [Rodentolepis nana]